MKKLVIINPFWNDSNEKDAVPLLLTKIENVGHEKAVAFVFDRRPDLGYRFYGETETEIIVEVIKDV